MRRASGAPVTLLVLAGLAAAGLGGLALVEARERADLRRELAEVRQEIAVRLGQAERQRDRVVVRAPFATWAHLVAGLHEAAAASRLDRFRYATVGVVPVTDPTAPLPTSSPGGKDGSTEPAPAARKGSPRGGAGGSAQEAPAPYRAMRARVEGSGSYGQIVSFVRALAAVDPPLSLDRIVVRAGPGGPSFEAYVHLVTALPVETPRVVALDRALPVSLPPEVDRALAGLVPPAPAPVAGDGPAEVQR